MRTMYRSASLLTRPYLRNNIFIKRGKQLTMANVNPMVKQMYVMDIDDPVYRKYLKLKKQLVKCPGSLPFDDLLPAISGDLQSSGYPPITFLRQVASAALYPCLIEHSDLPDDVKCKAKLALEHHVSLGSYTASPGVAMFREKLAKYISKRDGGLPCNPDDILLNSGTSEGMRVMMNMFVECIDNKPPGALIPNPSYPYNIVEEYGFQPIYYKLEEGKNWTPCMNIMETLVKEARKKCTPRVLVIINPGNPTGVVFKRDKMEELIKFACKEKLVILVDEVYQTNVYSKYKFISFKKVLHEMGKPYSDMELTSFFSLSKGYTGEAGIRAGMMELNNYDTAVMEQVRKSVSVRLCSSTVGQLMVYAFADHPVEGDPSFKLWKEEIECRRQDFECKAVMLVDALNEIEGFCCKAMEGGYFAYPQITVPQKAVKEGMKLCQKPSTFYALKLLEETGVLVTPGDVFGDEQIPHIRISILPSWEKLQTIVQRIDCFNEKFLKHYGSC